MLYPIVWILTAAGGMLITARAAAHVSAHGPLFKRNHRGIDVATAAGVAPLAGGSAALALPALIAAIRSDDVVLSRDLGVALTGSLVALSFAALGLWDDLAGTSDERGWRAHVRAVRERRMTAGAIKLLTGSGLALVIAAASAGEQTGLGWTLARAATLALAANTFNLLDLRPGRAAKFFFVAVLPFIVLAAQVRAPFFLVACVILAFLPSDLRERAMLGDTGANALGALVGYGIIVVGSPTAILISLGVLTLLNVVGERPGLSKIIDRVPPLRAFDQAGRARA